jgi:hypothetical protein
VEVNKGSVSRGGTKAEAEALKEELCDSNRAEVGLGHDQAG